jgi:hypothetical protein
MSNIASSAESVILTEFNEKVNQLTNKSVMRSMAKVIGLLLLLGPSLFLHNPTELSL